MRRDWTLPLVAAAVSLMISLVGLGTPDLWFDEVATKVSAERSWPALVAMLDQVDAVHAVYYAGLHVWVGAFGSSPLSLRLPSALAVALTTALVARFALLEWGPRAAVISTLVFVALPRTVWMAIEARSFAVATACLMVAAYLLHRAVATGATWRWVGYAAALALAATTYIHTLLVAPALFLPLALRLRGQRSRLTALTVATATGCLAAAPVVVAGVGQRQQIAWVEKVDAGTLLQLPRIVLGGFLGRSFPNWMILLLSAGGALVVALIAWRVIARLRDPRRTSDERTWLAVLVSWAIVPTLVLLLAGTVLPLYDPKYVAHTMPAIALLAGAGLSVGSRRWAAVALATVTVLGAVYWVTIRKPEAKSDMRAVAAWVAENRTGHDVVWFPRTGVPRAVAHAHPEAFRDLPDLTLDQGIEQVGTLWETDRPLQEVAGRLPSGTRIVAISVGDPPGQERAELAALGYSPGETHDLGEYAVTLFLPSR